MGIGSVPLFLRVMLEISNTNLCKSYTLGKHRKRDDFKQLGEQ